MQQLDFAELDEDGRLVVAADDGTRYAVPVDDRLRAAVRAWPGGARTGAEGPTAGPRDVQAMIRAGQTAEEVAEATGWDTERVRRFEGPVLAEREHVVGLAKAAPVRAQGRTDGSHTLDGRVRERLEGRGVPVAEIGWDAARSESHGPWTVLVVFTAGGRERRAAWHYDVHDRSVDALDDEARWLSEDEQALPGGLAGHPLLGGSHSEDETADLMATMRERRQARGRRGRRPDGDPEGRAAGGRHEEEVLPLENLPEPVARTTGDDGPGAEPGELPPAAHPRGSAPESPAPVTPTDEDSPQGGSSGEDRTEAADVSGQEVDDRPTPARRRGGAKEPRSRRERRRLRMPKLPPAVGEPPESDEDAETGSEGSFARTVDPQEVSFDEFFGPEDDPLGADGAADAADAAAVGDGPEAEAGDLAEDLDPGQDEPVDPDEQIDAGRPATGDDADEAVPAPGPVEDEDDAAEGETDPAEGETDPAVDDPAADGREGSAQEHQDEEPSGAPEPAEDPVPASDPRDVDAVPDDDQEPATRRKGRTSVPSWDDIMFGGGDRRRR